MGERILETNLCFQFNKYLLFSSFVGGAIKHKRNTVPTYE